MKATPTAIPDVIVIEPKVLVMSADFSSRVIMRKYFQS